MKIPTKSLFQVIHRLGYISLLMLGYYFIDRGDILQKYNSRRTNFAEYYENVTEMPTIGIRVEYSNQTLPEFSQSVGTFLGPPMNGELTPGYINLINHEKEGNVTVFFEEIERTVFIRGFARKEYRLTPISPAGKSYNFYLGFTFGFESIENVSLQVNVSRIGIWLYTQNNSGCGDGNFYDVT